MKCPKCRKSMVKQKESEHVYVYVCPSCNTKVGGN